jgi:hypothetical protein
MWLQHGGSFSEDMSGHSLLSGRPNTYVFGFERGRVLKGSHRGGLSRSQRIPLGPFLA